MKKIVLLLFALAPVTFAAEGLLPKDFQRGVNYAHVHKRGQGYGSATSRQELRQLAKLGITWVALTPFGYQDGAMADAVAGYDGGKGKGKFYSQEDKTLTDADLVAQINDAHARKMGVTLKPHIWSSDFWGTRQWQGTINQPTAEAHRAWWDSYAAFVMHYARLAESAHVEQFCMGTELIHMTTADPSYEAGWRALIAQVRKVYHGKLLYAAHWENEFEKITFWDALDAIGVTAYFPLDASTGASSTELASYWRGPVERLEAISQKYHKPILFMEAGYRPVAETYQRPWDMEGGTPEPLAQARAYDAMFLALRDKTWWKGVYIWKAFTDSDSEQVDSYAFRHLPAEEVILKWFGKAERTKP